MKKFYGELKLHHCEKTLYFHEEPKVCINEFLTTLFDRKFPNFRNFPTIATMLMEYKDLVSFEI